MKLLFDENLSPRLVDHLADLYPNSEHVRNLSLTSTADRQIWDAAAVGGFIIVSKDDDFHHLSFALGAPPKIIGLKLGNCTTSLIEQVIRSNSAIIQEFGRDSEASFLSLP